MADATVEVLINSVANTQGFAVAKAEMSALGGSGGLSGIGLGGAAKGELATAERDVAAEGNAVARAFSSMGVAGAEAGGRLSALGGVMSSSGALGIGIGASIVGLGAVFEMGKSMLDNADKQETAQKNLAAAYATLGEKIPTKTIDDFIDKNSKFIGSMYEAENAFAAAARAGFSDAMQLRLVSDATDLAAAHHIPLTQAMDQLIKVSTGNTKALTDLGISAKQVEDPVKALATAHQAVEKATTEHTRAVRTLDEWEAAHSNRAKLTQAELMHEQDLKERVTKSTGDLTNANAELDGATVTAAKDGDKFTTILDILEKRTRGQRDTTSDLHQNTSQLSVSWEKLSNENGPALEGMLSAVVDRTTKVIDGFRWFGENQAIWNGINAGVLYAFQPLIGAATLVRDIAAGIDYINSHMPNVPNGGYTSAAIPTGGNQRVRSYGRP